MRTCSLSKWHLVGVVLMLVVGVAVGQNATSDGSTANSDRSPIEMGMAPFFSMTNFFLSLIRPNSDEWLAEDLDLGAVLEGNYSHFQDDWQTIAKYFTGYLVCLVIGILFIICMFLWGCVFCCCCCCCSKDSTKMGGRRAKLKRISCGALLFIFTTIILIGAVLCFLSNELLWQQTNSDNGIINSAVTRVGQVDMFIEGSFSEVERIADEVGEEVDSLIIKVETLPVTISEKLDELLNANEILRHAEDLANNVTKLGTIMTDVTSLTDNLNTLRGDLDTALGDLQSDLQNPLSNNCPSSLEADCDELLNTIQALQSVADFSGVDDIQNQLDQINDVNSNDLEGLISEAQSQYDDIQDQITEQIENQVNAVRSVANDMKSQVTEEVAELRQYVEDELEFQGIVDNIKANEAEIETYGEYRKYGGIAIGCILIIVAFLFFLGLMFGCCGDPPYDGGSCNRGTGASLLMGGIIWCFLFSWILMLVTIVLFTPGGLIQTELCRYVVDLGDTPESVRALAVIDEILENQDIAIPNNLTVSSLIMSCSQGAGLYSALNLEQQVNLSEYLDLDQYDLQERMEDLESVNFNLQNTEIITSDMRTQLNNLKDSGLEDIDFQSFEDQLQLAVVSANLLPLAEKMDNLAADARNVNANGFANTLSGSATDLRTLQSGTVTAITTDMTALSGKINELKTIATQPEPFSVRVEDLIDLFDSTQDTIQNDGGAQLVDLLQAEVNNIYDDFQRFLRDLLRRVNTEIASCQPAYDIINNFISEDFCWDFLTAFNTWWFSIGWCLAFFIPAIIVAIVLKNEYQKDDINEPIDSKSFDDPNFDAYVGMMPGDNIPLEDNRARVY